MAFLKKLFGPKSLQDQARRLFEQGEYVRLVQMAAEQDLPDAETQALVDQAKSILRQKNLDEARLRLEQGDEAAAQEHLDLALQFGATAAELASIRSGLKETHEPIAPVTSTCTGCAGHDPEGEKTPERENETLDEGDILELLLAGLDAETADIYRQKSSVFHQALIAASQGDDQTALHLLEGCPEQDRDTCYDFELASVLVRLGRSEEGLQVLRRCLAGFPATPLPWEMAVDLALQGTVLDGLKEKLIDLGRHTETAAWANQLLCRWAWRSGDADAALACGKAALEYGSQDPEVLQIVALVLERRGDFEQAEQLLARLPAAGCGGGVHPLLAEFWLRRKKNLSRVLESFKAMARQEPGNPLWQLRIAETCVALGWPDEALKIIKVLEAAPEASSSLRDAVQQLRSRIAPT